VTLDIYEMRAQVAKALAHPIRLRIIDLLMQHKELCVCDINRSIDVSQPSISKHLGILKDAGILDSHKEGLMVFYRVRMPCVKQFFGCLDRVLALDVEARKNELAPGGDG